MQGTAQPRFYLITGYERPPPKRLNQYGCLGGDRLLVEELRLIYNYSRLLTMVLRSGLLLQTINQRAHCSLRSLFCERQNGNDSRRKYLAQIIR